MMPAKADATGGVCPPEIISNPDIRSGEIFLEREYPGAITREHDPTVGIVLISVLSMEPG